MDPGHLLTFTTLGFSGKVSWLQASGAAFLGNLPFVELQAKAFPTLLRRTESSPPYPHLPRQKLHCQLHSGYLLSKLSLLLLAKLQYHAKVIA